MARTKHIPKRTCVGCRTTSDKREFLRIVRTPEGRVAIDATGKQSGRGAYSCAQRSCWEAALEKGRLARALRTTISPENLAELRAHAEQLEPVAVGSS